MWPNRFPLLRASGHLDRPPDPVVLMEGTEGRAVLTFKVAGDAVEGLKVVDVRWQAGRKVQVCTREVFLGDFRVGGPYEVALPVEQQPSGSAARGFHESRARLINADHDILGEQAYSFEIKRPLS